MSYSRFSGDTAVSLAIGVLLLIGSTRAACSVPNDLQIVRINAARGLTGRFVSCVASDRSGYMWMGTRLGLHRFDGRQMKIYRHNADDTNSLPADPVLCVALDADTVVYVGTSNGLARLVRRTGRIQRIPAGPYGMHVRVNDVVVDREQGILVATDRGICVLQPDGATVRRVVPLPRTPAGHVAAVLSTTFYNGRIVCSTPLASGSEISTFDGSQWHADNVGERVLATHGSFRLVRTPELTIVRYGALDTLDCTHMFREFGFALEHAVHRQLCVDRNGTVWLATPTMVVGFVRKNIRSVAFLAMDDDVRALELQADGTLLAGTSGGDIYRLPSNGGSAQHVSNVGSPVNALKQTRMGTIFVGTTGRGIGTINGSHYTAGRMQRSSYAISVYGDTVILTDNVSRDRRSTIVLATMTRKARVFLDSTVMAPNAWCVLRRRNGQFLLGAADGIHAWNVGRSSDRVRVRGLDQRHSIGDVWHLREDALGRIWVSSWGAGLLVLDSTLQLLHHEPASNILPQSLVQFTASDGAGRIWIGTSNGLAVVDSSFKIVRRIGVSDGLLAQDLWQGAVAVLKNGTIAVGGAGGVSIVDPSIITPRSEDLVLHATDVRSDGNLVVDDFSSFDDVLVLPSFTSSVALRICAPDPVNPDRIHYRYMVEGGDDVWHTTLSGEIVVNALKAGVTVIRVSADAGDGRFVERQLRILVPQPWWASTWFAVVVGCIVLAGIGTLLVRRIRVRERLRAQRIQTLDLELQSLRLQMNPHFMFNVLTTMQAVILRGNSRMAVEMVSTFARLMRRTLEQSRERTITLADEIATIKLYVELEQARFPEQISVEWLIDEHVDPATCHVPPFLLQPFVENAIVHGLHGRTEGGTVRIAIHSVAGGLVIDVRDNGIGRRAARERKRHRTHDPLGMAVTSERIRRLNEVYDGTFAVEITDEYSEQGVPIGTTVRVAINTQDVLQ